MGKRARRRRAGKRKAALKVEQRLMWKRLTASNISKPTEHVLHGKSGSGKSYATAFWSGYQVLRPENYSVILSGITA